MDRSRLAELKIPRVRTAAGAARRWLAAIGVPLPEDRLDDLKFCANELIINSIIHADTDAEIVVAVDVTPRAIRVAVTDAGRPLGPLAARDAGPEDTAGRGLSLVEAIADRWGVHQDGLTSVWFEMDRSPLSA
jgi:anti-sigma regulatory factor (Ser/Thr protein kinase)